MLRTIAMCAIGTVTGILVGVGLGWFVASSIGVGGEGATPVPPLVLVAPWLPDRWRSPAALLLLLGVAVLAAHATALRPASLGAGVR